MTDSHNLKRFVDAQNHSINNVLLELKNGQKTSHWMWWIFPQIAGLGKSDISIYYSISGKEEAKSYMAHETLWKNYLDCCNALLAFHAQNPGKNIREIMGGIDGLKLNSSLSLFLLCSPDKVSATILKQTIDTFYNGELCTKTCNILGK